ncbi:hypothetical protein SAMN05421771_2286 [Granulicella pectinivorans]|jgi:hypothetical protein|uniref:DUF4136 domain-containing protein n=1 Tax=Granulicella pectinivorans TaxID=474950 RepID=A0A1I6MCR2_9BACT|nr:DUF4136 domain-containing protein [Granulicella pectinivorans]SFS13372.1 hypothetical protein SAMN05421771_2286 [Granulicella pectinivorans]
MRCTLRNSLSLSLILLLAATPILRAQSSPSTQAPLPSQITSAHTIFLSNAGAPNLYDAFTGGPNRAYNTLYADLRQWNHYQFVPTPAEADLILEISAVAPIVDASAHTGPIYNPQLILRLLDPKTHAVLWTTTANVHASGRQKNRDKGFDESVDVLVTQLRQLNGEALTPTQTVALQKNARSFTPTGVKIFLIAGIAGAVALGAYGAYRVSHPPSLQQPTLP